MYRQYKLAYTCSLVQIICLNSRWQVYKYSTVQASLPASWPAEHMLALHASRIQVQYKQAYLQPGSQNICLSCTMLAGLHVQYKEAYLQPGLQSICLYSCWQISMYSTS